MPACLSQVPVTLQMMACAEPINVRGCVYQRHPTALYCAPHSSLFHDSEMRGPVWGASVEEVRPLCIGKQVEEEVDHLMVYDRYTPLDCLPYSFGRGHLFTQIAFYSAEEGPTGDPEIKRKANNSDDEYYTASDHKVGGLC